MERSVLSSPACRYAARISGGLVVAVGMAALAGWATANPILLGLRASYIPMAPNTALSFLLMGSALIGAVGDRRSGRRVAGWGAVLVGSIALLRLAESAGGVPFDVDRWFVRVNVQGSRFGLAPIGKMSIPTASAFVAAGTAILSLAWLSRWEASGHLAGAGGILAGAMGLVFALGYLFSPNAPLLYGTESIPMALNTSLCFVGLGVGIAAAAGPGAFPLVRLSGSSIRARLLRIFLPLIVGIVGVVAWLTHLVITKAGASSAAISSAALATAAIVLFALICERVAGRVGGQIDRAEAALKQAHDELERKVDERTQALSRANAEIAESLRETRLAHESLQRAHHELKQAQTRMLQQARLASLGQTAAGVAHEINNPLAFVTNNVVVLGREIRGIHEILMLYQQAEQTLAESQGDLYSKIDELSREFDLPFVLGNLDGLLERTRAGLLRIQKIVSDLRDFAHLEEADFKEADLNVEIGTTLRLMRTLAAQRDVTLESALGPIPRTSCYPAKINLVVQSLISNAIDACPTGGRVVVETCEVDSEIEIRISDNGCGIAPAIRDRIFDPFFTTKAAGKGTGLGLPISLGTVRDHGGTIEFESTPGQGTRFTVRLPARHPPGHDGPSPRVESHDASRG